MGGRLMEGVGDLACMLISLFVLVCRETDL